MQESLGRVISLHKLLQMLFQNHHLLYILIHPDPAVGLYPMPRYYTPVIWDHHPENAPSLRHWENEWGISSHVCSNFIHLLVVHPSKRPVIGAMTDLEGVSEAEK